MRDKYVRLVKVYLNSKPDYKDAIKEIKANLLTVGVSEEEFEAAIKQLGTPLTITEEKQQTTVVVEKNQKKEQTTFSLRLLKLDVAANLIVLLLAIVLGTVFLIGPLLSPQKQTPNVNQDNNSLQTISPQELTKQVYANEKEVDATKIFSYKPLQVTLYTSGKPKKEVYGFFPYWMIPEQDKINLNTVTTIGLFGLETDGAGNIITNRDAEPDGGWAMWNDPELDKFVKRAKSRRIKIELIIKAFDSSNIERLVTSEKAQQLFISNVIQALNTKSLNGVNLDFEYVGTPDTKITEGFTNLVSNLRAELKRQLPNSTLTLDAYVNAAALPKLLDIEALADKVDAIIVMGYDVHTPAGSAGPIAPINGEVSITGYMQSFLDKVDPEKLILGVPYYGYDWPVPNVSGTAEVKILPYAEIADASKNSTIMWDDTSDSPSYKYVDSNTNTTREVHFENPRSLGVKYDFVNRKNLRGIAIWALGYDGLNSDLRALILEKF